MSALSKEEIQDILTDGMKWHILRKFGFCEMKLLEASYGARGPESIAFSVNGIGWVWTMDSDDVVRAPEHDEVEVWVR